MISTPARFNEVFARLKSVKSHAWGWTAICPAHDDDRRSLSLSLGEGGGLLVKCHANKGCTFDAIVRGLNLEPEDFFPEKEREVSRKLKTTYDYKDEHGNLLYQVVRWEPKGFAQRRKEPGSDEWVWNLGEVRRVPYNLPALVAAEGKRKILIVEGEKDADALTKIGFLATTNSGGAGKWPESGNDVFRASHIAIFPDNDAPGKQHAVDIAGKLSVIASSIKIIQLPDLPEKGDVSDWIAAGGTREKLIQLIEQAPFYSQGAVATQTQSNSKSEGVPANEDDTVAKICRLGETLPIDDLILSVRALLLVLERRVAK